MPQLISDEWRELNAELHQRNAKFGSGGWRWANAVVDIAARYQCDTVLDYGCGKNTLAEYLKGGLDIRSYDPAVPEFAAAPEPADLLVCVDVLEHIEPVLLEDTLHYLSYLTKKVAFLCIGTRPSDKTMADQRNAHTIIGPMEWWLDRLRVHFRIEKEHDMFEKGFFSRYRRPKFVPKGAAQNRTKLRTGLAVSAPSREFVCLAFPLA